MEEKNEVDKIDDVILPGFRFHPTDEELVGFYLKRKILQQTLPIELIKQVDIYKYDPWDLPKLAATGEKEWYFYCPRDRKYRNSARPNRVTGAGFWKATGTDRPIYSSEGNKCIGLKKSLVFYKGRAAKGIKTDWMMHEFRLASLGDCLPSRRCLDKNFPSCDSWAICRIFKKTSPITPRTLSHSWVSPSLLESPPSNANKNSFNSQENSNKTSSNTPPMKLNNSNNNVGELDHVLLQSPNTFSFSDIPTFKPIYPTTFSNNNDNNNNNDNKPTSNYHHILPNINPTLLDLPPSYILPQLEDTSDSSKPNIDISSMLLNMSSMVHGDFNKPCGHGNYNEYGVETNNDFGPTCTLSQGDHHSFQNVQSALMENLHNLVNVDHNDFGGIENIGSIPMAGFLPLALPE